MTKAFNAIKAPRACWAKAASGLRVAAINGKRLGRLLLPLAAGLGFAAAAGAAGYPDHPVTLVVPYTAGTMDNLARMIAQRLGPELGQSVIVMNKPGAGGAVGGAFVSRAKPDGYTLLISATGPISISPVVYKDLGYKPATDLAPVVQLTASPFALATSEAFKGNSVKDLIALLKSHPGKYNYASTGNGTIVHLFGEYFKKLTGTQFTHIPYPGGAPATMAMLKGDVLFSITNIPNVQSQIAAHKLKGLATTGATRSPALPDLPTMTEAGVKDFDLIGWFGMFAPKGTPEPILEKINAAVSKVMNDPQVKKLLLAQGDEVHTQSVPEFRAFIAKSDASWAKIARDAHVTVQ
jgi:tripartite-type tricarboxylate transporter receptor subunit TctC